ncbi:MAG: PTS mannose/fructose/sorbose transporter subunit IIC [Selenomonadaceae bacterium]|nr:PTS mannose/fructose/sorbose transporter subunit IIC [Selenomonadaceae bacterium]
MSSIQILLIFIFATIAGMGSCLDEMQTHRPLIACTITGLILGDITTGIIIGGTLEMMALGWMNIGAAIAPDAALASVISTILVIASHQDVATGIAIAMPLAAAGQVLAIICKTVSVVFQHKADDYAEEGNLFGIDLCNYGALILQGLRVGIPALLVAMTVGTGAVENMLSAIPPVISGGLQVAGGFIVVVGYAMVINMMGAQYLMPFFFLGFVVAAFTNFNLVALGVIGLVAAVVYIQLNPKYQAVAAAPAAAASGSDDDLDDELD